MNPIKLTPPEDFNMPQDNCIEAENHTLFWEKNDPELRPLEDIEEGNFYEQIEGFTTYKLFIGDFMETKNGIQKIINKLQQADPQDILEIHIASNGGSVDELLQIYNLCNTLFYGRVATFANHAYSAGAWTFLFGVDRILFEHSNLMWHSYSTGAGGKRQDLLDHLHHEDKRINKFLMGTLEPYFTKKEIKKMNKGKDYWIDTLEACKRGICTDVALNGEFLSADEYVERIQPGWIKMKEEAKKIAEKEFKKEQKKEKKAKKKIEKELSEVEFDIVKKPKKSKKAIKDKK